MALVEFARVSARSCMPDDPLRPSKVDPSASDEGEPESTRELIDRARQGDQEAVEPAVRATSAATTALGERTVTAVGSRFRRHRRSCPGRPASDV